MLLGNVYQRIGIYTDSFAKTVKLYDSIFCCCCCCCCYHYFNIHRVNIFINYFQTLETEFSLNRSSISLSSARRWSICCTDESRNWILSRNLRLMTLHASHKYLIVFLLHFSDHLAVAVCFCCFFFLVLFINYCSQSLWTANHQLSQKPTANSHEICSLSLSIYKYIPYKRINKTKMVELREKEWVNKIERKIEEGKRTKNDLVTASFHIHEQNSNLLFFGMVVQFWPDAILWIPHISRHEHINLCCF